MLTLWKGRRWFGYMTVCSELGAASAMPRRCPHLNSGDSALGEVSDTVIDLDHLTRLDSDLVQRRGIALAAQVPSISKPGPTSAFSGN